jgi:hypothetical protein
MGGPRGKILSRGKPDVRSEAKRGEASYNPAPERLKNFPRGPPLRAEKQNSGFHKDLIKGVFLFFSPGHLPKKPSPFTHFFLNFHISLIFSLLLAADFFPKSKR